MVGIELAYINTKHPDFEEARLIYRGLTDDFQDSSDLRKVSMHNAIVGSSNKQVVTLLTRNTPIGVVLREPLVEFDLTEQFCNNHDYIWI